MSFVINIFTIVISVICSLKVLKIKKNISKIITLLGKDSNPTTNWAYMRAYQQLLLISCYSRIMGLCLSGLCSGTVPCRKASERRLYGCYCWSLRFFPHPYTTDISIQRWHQHYMWSWLILQDRICQSLDFCLEWALDCWLFGKKKKKQEF